MIQTWFDTYRCGGVDALTYDARVDNPGRPSELSGQALTEMQHPVQSSFAALGPVSAMLAATVVLPYSRPVALALFAVAVVVQLALGLYLHGRFWQGGRKPELVTPAIYLPAVAQNFVAGTTASAACRVARNFGAGRSGGSVRYPTQFCLAE